MHKRGLRNRQGRGVSLNGISTMLNNPFYIGVMRIRKTDELFTGIHVPIVGKALFDTVQEILKGKTVVRTHKHEFAFSRMFRCQLCSRTLMAELQKGHSYYRCHTPKCGTKTLREERINDALADAFAPLQLNEAEVAYAQHWIQRKRTNRSDWQKQEREHCQLGLAQLQNRVLRLTDAYLDGVLDKELLEERRGSLLMEESGLKQKIADLEAGQSDTLVQTEKFLELVKSASNLHNLAITEEKRTLAKYLTSNLSAGPKYVEITLNAEAQVIAERPQLLSGRPNRGIPRTWDAILTHLVELFANEQAA